MILFGIDPGTATTGYGVIKVADDGTMAAIDYGNIKTSKESLMSERLAKIHTSASYLIQKFKPDVIIIEKLFFNTNVKTAITVGQARGVYLLVAGQNRIPVFEYTALEAKMALTGYGRAEKEDVLKRVTEILNIKVKIKPIDASDALAIAICHRVKGYTHIVKNIKPKKK